MWVILVVVALLVLVACWWMVDRTRNTGRPPRSSDWDTWPSDQMGL